MRELPITLFGARALVLGYGRIGKVLSAMLSALHAEVFVAARGQNDIANITVNGHRPIRFGDADFDRAIEKSEVIFNTVPAKVLTKQMLKKCDNCHLIIDLASGKGGTDFAAAEELGVKTVHALSLPGKVAPATAGNIIFDCILELLIREGVVARI